MRPGNVPGQQRACERRARDRGHIDLWIATRSGALNSQARCAIQSRPTGAHTAPFRAPRSHEASSEARTASSIDLGTVPGPTAHRAVGTSPAANIPRKEVIQPQLPLRLPCYDFVPVAGPTLGACVPKVRATILGITDSHDVTGGVYKARERIHRSMADLRLLATPASCRRVSACNPN